MKTDLFFKDVKSKNNIYLIESVDESIVSSFEAKYSQFNDKFFYEQFIKCGGIVVDDWIRLYGCGLLNVVEKNELYNKSNIVDILIGEDVLGGLFGLKNGLVFYFAPDTNEWENMEIYYTQFLDWLINRQDAVNKFYESYRWNSWKEDCKKIKLTEGYQFYPLLQSKHNIDERDRRIISMDELIRFNLSILKNKF